MASSAVSARKVHLSPERLSSLERCMINVAHDLPMDRLQAVYARHEIEMRSFDDNQLLSIVRHMMPITAWRTGLASARMKLLYANNGLLFDDWIRLGVAWALFNLGVRTSFTIEYTLFTEVAPEKIVSIVFVPDDWQALSRGEMSLRMAERLITEGKITPGAHIWASVPLEDVGGDDSELYQQFYESNEVDDEMVTGVPLEAVIEKHRLDGDWKRVEKQLRSG